MVFKLLLFLLCVMETLQHLSYPINFCNMASTCIHDSRVVCASSPDGCSRRSFLDQCDMYEYNCDYGTQYMTKVTSSCTSGYQETYILFCGTLLTSTQITQILSNMTESPTDPETSERTTKELTQTVTLTLSTSTPVTTTIGNHSEENDINNTNNDTTINPTTHVYCCDRPLTWETTTEVTRNYEDNTINDNSDEHRTSSEESSSEYNVTNVYDETTNVYDNNITLATINKKLSDTDTIDDTTIFVNTETEVDLDKKQSTIEIINLTTPEYCCNRPLTWETTTKVTKNDEDNTISDNSDEHKTNSEESSSEYNETNVYDETTNIYDNNITFTTINQKISGTDTIGDTTIFVNTETKEALDKKSSATDINQTTTEYCCDRPFTWETTTEVTKKIEDIANETNNSEDQKLTDTIDTNSYTEDTSKYSKTPLTLLTELLTKISFSSKVTKNCDDKCQRPITWLTTRRGRKHYWN